jgi:alpha-N-arabinofuranosidase
MKAHMIVSKDFTIGRTDERLFGSFVEHMGSVVYNGIYEPEHPAADEDGFRADVLELVRELQLNVVRYPGGNFTSGYRWEDGIGPKTSRPVKLDVAWKQIEPNTFGLDEFMRWSRKAGADPIMTVNLGTAGIQEAQNIVDYCNFARGSHWSELRRSHGIEKPYGIKTWCLGNELDGEWQIARKTADEYGRIACEAAKVMKWVDPGIKLVAVGSSARHMATYPQWDRVVLEHTYDHVDYVSLHNYIAKKEHDTATYLAMPLDMERQIRDIVAACDYVKAQKRSAKTMMLSFDEWNVWRAPDIEYIPWQTGCPLDWVKFHMEDALVFASAMLTLLKNADRVKIACQSLLVNTIPMILTEKNGKAWRNATFYPFAHISRFGRGEVLRVALDTPKYDTSVYTDVPVVDSVAVYNGEEEQLTVFAVNRSAEPVELAIDARDFAACSVIEHVVLSHSSLQAVNTAEHPFEVSPRSCFDTAADNGNVTSRLEPYSWNVIRLSTRPKE